jgi:outer membrane biosynthesis protein TonB
VDFKTVPNVELVTVGMKWPAMTGPVTVTFEHLADMLAAADDPHIQRGRVKLGHTDPRFDENDEVELGSHDPFFDGEPAFGSIDNLRLDNDGAVLVGDLVEVPEWLADAAPSAWPTRSCEWVWDVETAGGKKYSAVLTGVALGGVWTPAIKDLEDLQRAVELGPAEPVAAVGGDPDPMTVTARADIDKVLDLFYSDFAQEERYWWWPRSVWSDPNEIIADDDEGSLWRVPFTSNESQEVTFEEPIEVRQTFVDVRTGATAATVPELTGKPAAVFATAAEARPPDRKKGGVGSSSTVDRMDGKLLRQALGLSPEASDDEVEARVSERAAAAEAEPPAETPPAETPPEETPPEEEPPEETPPEETPPEEEPPAETPPEPEAAADGTVTVDKETWDETQRQARDGAAARAEQITEGRETLLRNAVKAGKFPPSRIDHYRQAHKADAKGTEDLIESLEAGIVPVEQRGSSADTSASGAVPDEVLASFGPQYVPKRDSS